MSTPILKLETTIFVVYDCKPDPRARIVCGVESANNRTKLKILSKHVIMEHLSCA
jgi:hypothetical protein